MSDKVSSSGVCGLQVAVGWTLSWESAGAGVGQMGERGWTGGSGQAPGNGEVLDVAVV